MLPTVAAPPTRPLSQLLPNEPLLLMGAGPTPIPFPVARANSVVINHLGPTMNSVLKGLKDMARYAFQTRAEHVIGVAGSASSAMEMAIGNLAWPGRKVLSLVTGTFSARLAEMARCVGADVTEVISPVATPATEALLREALAQGEFDLVTLVQGETSCGVLNVALPAIAKVARDAGALVIVDAVCTLTTTPLQMDNWGIDVCVTGGQKGLASIPGVSLIAFSDRAWNVVESRPRPMPHWCLDAQRAWRFWGHHKYHYTAPVPGILALYEALRLIAEETLEHRFHRHARSSAALQAGIEAMGLTLFVPAEFRLDSVVAFHRPTGVDSAKLRDRMVRQFGVEIAGAFGLDILRIGQMGEQCRSHNLFHVLYALGESTRLEGFACEVSEGMAALERTLVAHAEQP
jgi:alanine-glyoxylate transaminase / serine-glyoxylate transaminase / serine-pyruvate transaminase